MAWCAPTQLEDINGSYAHTAHVIYVDKNLASTALQDRWYPTLPCNLLSASLDNQNPWDSSQSGPNSNNATSKSTEATSPGTPEPGGPGPVRTCDPGRATLTVPAPLAAPIGKASGTLLGVGTQNYTCTAAGTYVSAGAVAELFDISCLIGTPAFDTVQDTGFKAWTASKDKSANTVNRAIPGLRDAGDHYFVVSPLGTGISPIWDQHKCGRANGNEGFIIGAKAAGCAAPTGSKDVDWLQITNVAGNLAKTVYRTNTRRGPAPASCTPGSPVLTVKYTSKYWFFQGLEPEATFPEKIVGYPVHTRHWPCCTSHPLGCHLLNLFTKT